MPEGILIIFNLATLKLSEIDNISVKNVKHVKLPVNLLFPVERLLQNYLSKNKQKPELSQAEAFLFP